MEQLRATDRRVPVTIVTGFLGAGKTSLLNHVLTGDHGLRVAVLVNDFGAVNIDAHLISARNAEVVSLENGCICCSLSDGLLATAMRLVRADEPPDHIVVETSGVSDPFEVANTFADPELQPYAPLDGIVTVVDAEIAPLLNGVERTLAERQVAAADVVLVNKIDLVDGDQRARAHEWVRGITPIVRILETERATAPIELLMHIDRSATADRWRPAVPSLTGVHNQEAAPFDTVLIESSSPISFERLQNALAAMPNTIFRAKGFLYIEERPENRIILQSTGRRAELIIGDEWGDDPPQTRIVFIGSRGGVDAAVLNATFKDGTTE